MIVLVREISPLDHHVLVYLLYSAKLFKVNEYGVKDEQNKVLRCRFASFFLDHMPLRKGHLLDPNDQ